MIPIAENDTMIPRIPEQHKKPGVCYAVTDGGLELPVIDITNPACLRPIRTVAA